MQTLPKVSKESLVNLRLARTLSPPSVYNYHANFVSAESGELHCRPERYLQCIAPYRKELVVAVECMFYWH